MRKSDEAKGRYESVIFSAETSEFLKTLPKYIRNKSLPDNILIALISQPHFYSVHAHHASPNPHPPFPPPTLTPSAPRPLHKPRRPSRSRTRLHTQHHARFSRGHTHLPLLPWTTQRRAVPIQHTLRRIPKWVLFRLHRPRFRRRYYDICSNNQ
jgi:hypothetical protein